MQILHGSFRTGQIGSHRQQIPVEGLVLAVPFKVKSHSVFQKIYIVAINISLDCLNFIRFLCKPSPSLSRLSGIFFYRQITAYPDFSCMITFILSRVWMQRGISEVSRRSLLMSWKKSGFTRKLWYAALDRVERLNSI